MLAKLTGKYKEATKAHRLFVDRIERTSAARKMQRKIEQADTGLGFDWDKFQNWESDAYTSSDDALIGVAKEFLDVQMTGRGGSTIKKSDRGLKLIKAVEEIAMQGWSWEIHGQAKQIAEILLGVIEERKGWATDEDEKVSTRIAYDFDALVTLAVDLGKALYRRGDSPPNPNDIVRHGEDLLGALKTGKEVDTQAEQFFLALCGGDTSLLSKFYKSES